MIYKAPKSQKESGRIVICDYFCHSCRHYYHHHYHQEHK